MPVAADAEYRDCSCCSASSQSESAVCNLPLPVSTAHGGLTPRSSGAPTAGHQARACGTPSIFTGPGLASCRCRPLSSNVRPRKMQPTRLFQRHLEVASTAKLFCFTAHRKSINWCQVMPSLKARQKQIQTPASPVAIRAKLCNVNQ